MDNANGNDSSKTDNSVFGSSPFFHSSSSDEEGESADDGSYDISTNQGQSQDSTQSEPAVLRHRKNGRNKSNDSANSGAKLCRVCGDKALGYNFNVISCESCKAFFRRNALKKKEFVCPFTNNCDVTCVSRRFCQKCRLRKCFEAGMNPDWIMSEEALAAKRRRRLQPNSVPEKRTKTGFEWRKITPAGSNEPVLIAANSIDGVTVLNNSSSSAQQQFALVTQQGAAGPKLFTILPVQHLQQSTTVLPQTTLDSSGANGTNVILAGTTHANSTMSMASNSSVSIQSIAGVKSEDDTINIPKTVLVSLITKCHSGNDGISSHDSGTSSGTLGQLVGASTKGRCTCTCICGAKSISDSIGVEKSDKMVSTEDLSLLEEQIRRNGSGASLASSFGYAKTNVAVSSNNTAPTSTAPLDFTTNATRRGCRALSQQVIPHQHHVAAYAVRPQSMYGDMLDAAIVSGFQDGNGSSVCANFGVSSLQPNLDSHLMYSGRFRQLSVVERQRLDELVAANELMKEPFEGISEQRIYEGHNIDPKLMDVINMTDIAVRRIIKMNKRIEAFRNLCQEDQIALLKGGCTELMILRGVMTYDPEKDSWLTQVHNTGHEYIKLEVLKGVKGNVYEEHKKYVQSFPAVWRTSEPIMLILGAITLFCPTRPNIVHAELIKLEQQFYYELLKSYLATIYDVHESESTYAALVGRLETLHRVNEYAASIFLDVNPRDVEPLLREIFDLKK